jgi:hypothetical protein
VTELLPREDPCDALIGEQAARIAALVAELQEQPEAAVRAASRNGGNSSMWPGADDLPGRKPDRILDHYPEGAAPAARTSQVADLGVARS